MAKSSFVVLVNMVWLAIHVITNNLEDIHAAASMALNCSYIQLIHTYSWP